MPDLLNKIHFMRQPQQLQGHQHLGKTRNKEQLETACKEFESLFVSYMMQQMRATIPEDGLINRSQAEKIYTGMLDNEVAKTVSYSQGMGLAKAMYEQMAAILSDASQKK